MRTWRFTVRSLVRFCSGNISSLGSSNIPRSSWILVSFIELTRVFRSLAAIFVILMTVSASPGLFALRTAIHIVLIASIIVLVTFLLLSYIKKKLVRNTLRSSYIHEHCLVKDWL